MWQAANVLPNSPKILHRTNKDVFWVNLWLINGKLRWKSCQADLNSVCLPSTLWLRKSVPKQELSDIQATTYFDANNFPTI